MLTPEQKEQRRQGIGGSDAAAIAGLSRYKSNVDVYLEKKGFKADDGGCEAAYWGDVLESIVLKEYAKKNKQEIMHYSSLFCSEKYPWMIANIDGYMKDKNAILECKTASAYKSGEWGEQETDEIPDEYLLQCAHYRIVTDCNFVAIAVLIGGQEYRQYKYEKNEALEEQLIDIEHDFWHNNYLKNIAPEILSYDDAIKLFNKALPTKKTANEEILSYLQSYLYAKDQAKGFEQQIDSLKAKIAAFLGENSILVNETGQELATWNAKKINRFDVSEFKKVHPELYTQFTKTCETREFRLKGA